MPSSSSTPSSSLSLSRGQPMAHHQNSHHHPAVQNHHQQQQHQQYTSAIQHHSSSSGAGSSHHQSQQHLFASPPSSSSSSMNVAFPSLVTPIITTVDHSSIMSSQNQSSSQAAVVSSHELTKLQAQNQTLMKKLQLKNQENDKLQRKIDRVESELGQYKDLLTQINMNLEHGQALNSDAVKFAIQTAVNSMKNGKAAAAQQKKRFGKWQFPKRSGCNSSTRCHCEADRPFQCDFPECGKRFLQKHHLDSHRAIHTGTRFICDWNGCGKSFVRKYNLQEHTKMHQDDSHNRCMYPACGMVFSSKYSLIRHQAAQHQIIAN